MNVFVATTSYQHHVFAAYATSIARDCLLATKTPYMIAPPVFADGGLISFNRNELFKQFLAAPIFDTMVFIDSDLGWETAGLIKLLETPGDIVGGAYRKKQDEVEYSFYTLDAELPLSYCAAEAVPGGFLKITRRAAQQIADAYPKPFAQISDGDLEYGEDISFCKRARALGLSITVRLDIEFTHYGVTGWSGRAQDDLAQFVKGTDNV